MKQAKLTLGALADAEGARHHLCLRVAQPEPHRLLVDLGSDRVIEIDGVGWRVAPFPPHTFRRSPLQGKLPLPDPDGTPADLLTLLGLLRVDEPDLLLLACWLVTALYPGIAHAILALHGRGGTAKSTTARLLRLLIDPGHDDLLQAPRDQEALFVAATSRWLLAFDNLSSLPAWLSDLLCLTSTGGAIPRRKLYTDADELLFDLQRVVVLTSVAQLAEREDLLSRTYLVALNPILEDERMTEDEWTSKVQALLPRALAGLYTAAGHVLGAMRQRRSRPQRLPRLADWATIAALAAEAFGSSQEDFFRAWHVASQRAESAAAEASDLPRVVEHFLLHNSNGPCWEGLTSELHSVLTTVAGNMYPPVDTRHSSWPRDARWLGKRIAEQEVAMAARGITISRRETNRGTVLSLTGGVSIPL